MFWRKLAEATQHIASTIAVAGIFVAAIALASGNIIPLESILVATGGCVIWFLGLIWEDFLNWLYYKRSSKRNRNKKSA